MIKFRNSLLNSFNIKLPDGIHGKFIRHPTRFNFPGCSAAHNFFPYQRKDQDIAEKNITCRTVDFLW